MKSILLFLILNFHALADEHRHGLGAILGSSTGVSGNYILKRNRSIDAVLGFGLGNKTKIGFHSSILYHTPESLKIFGQVFGWFYGLGAKIKLVETDDDTEFRVGPRASLGAIWDFSKVPCDLFIDSGITMIIIPKNSAEAGVSVGGRYYF